MQLIFRINQQQQRNIKYKLKGQANLDGHSREGQSPANAIHIDSQRSSPANAVEPTTDENLREVPPLSIVDQWLSNTANFPSNDQRSNHEAVPTCDSNSSHIQQPPGDIYEVPLSPGTTRATVCSETASRHSTLSAARKVETLIWIQEPVRQTDSPGKNAKRGIETEKSNDQTTTPKRRITVPTTYLPKKPGRAPRGKKSSASSAKRAVPKESGAARRQRTAVQKKQALTAQAINAERSGRVEDSQNDKPEQLPRNLTSLSKSNPSEALPIPGAVKQVSREGIPTSTSDDSSLAISITRSSNVLERVPMYNASTIRSAYSHTPPSLSEGLKATQNPIDNNGQATAGTKRKVNIEIMFRVIVSRSPKYLCKGWQPRGTFQNKSLQELWAELPIQGTFKGLAFALEGPDMRYEEEINRDDDTRFEIMKKQFLRSIRACLEKAHDKTLLVFEIEIEPIREESEQVNDESDEADIIF